MAAFAALAVVAVMGWTKKASEPQYAATANPGAFSYSQPVPAQSDVYGQSPQPVNFQTNPCVQPGTYATPVLYGPEHGPARYVRTVRQPPARVVSGEYFPQAPVPSRSRVVRKRSLGKSAAIVAGSAGVGAAIGASGKGAAIGALTAGAGGFVYDRMTHVRRE